MRILFNELKNYKISLLLILVFTYISTIFELIMPILLANALNIGILQNYGMDYIYKIVVSMAFFIIISIILNTITTYLINRISIYSSCQIKNNLFEKVLSLKATEGLSSSTLLTRTTTDIDQIKGFISSFLSIIFKAPILFINCLTVLQTLHKNFSIITIVGLIIILIYLLIVIIKLFPLSKQMQSKIDNTNRLLKEKITNIKLIKSYNNLKKQEQDFKNANNDYLQTTKKIITTSSFVTPFLNLIINATTIIILAISINLVKTNVMQAGTIIATVQYILQIILAIIMLSMIALLIPKTHTSLSRINEIMNKETHISSNTQINLQLDNITINKLSFAYNETKILEDISLSITKEENIGIIGPTGSGKSTLAKLLIKEYEIANNAIFIDDIDINKISRKDIVSNITYSPQINTILTGTILENIMFANPSITKQEIALIVHVSNLSNFLMQQKDKLDHKLEQNGANLSNGQKQRICLARALASKSKIIILDEPFSALDYKNEKEIIANLNTYYKHKTFITISQRISSIKNCDKIIVMDKGKIIATGNHEELLKTNEIYKDMYESQKEVIEYDI